VFVDVLLAAAGGEKLGEEGRVGTTPLLISTRGRGMPDGSNDCGAAALIDERIAGIEHQIDRGIGDAASSASVPAKAAGALSCVISGWPSGASSGEGAAKGSPSLAVCFRGRRGVDRRQRPGGWRG